MDGQLVVIIDDRITNLKILERLASALGAGMRTRTFGDPFEALAAAVEDPPDLVVIDGRLRECGAEEFIGRLHAQPRGAGVPVVVAAAADDRELRDRALDAGAADCLTSPVDHREFHARLGNLLALRRQRLASATTADTALHRRSLAEERRHSDASQQSHERLLRVIEAVPAMIAATDRDGRWVFVNNRFAALVGQRPSRLIGKRPTEIRPDPFFRRLADLDARMLAGEIPPGSDEEEIVDAAGEPRLLLTTKSAFRGSDAEAMVVTVAIDITERKHAERDLIAAKETAEIANRSKTEFLANMSHELRTPLNAIIGFSQVMAGEMLGPITTKKYVGYARDIAGSAEHLLGIINDILDVSKLEAGKLDLVEEPIDLPKTIRDLMRLVEQKARAGDVHTVLRLDRDLPPLRADVRKVKQILLNVIGNAIKFSQPGGAVEIAGGIENGAIVITVTDHGIGMDHKELAVAVSRFGQVASAWSRKHAGTGLGLPLAIGLTELHGGRLAVESSKGTGTTVTIRFPRERAMFRPALVGPESRAAEAD